MLNKRLIKIRDYFRLNQRDFAQRLGISQPALAMFEKGDRDLKNIHIKRICDEFNVNESWLRTGEGGDTNMFLEPLKNDLVSKAAILLGEKDPVFEAFVDTYSKLTPTNRKVLLDFGMEFLTHLNPSKNSD